LKISQFKIFKKWKSNPTLYNVYQAFCIARQDSNFCEICIVKYFRYTYIWRGGKGLFSCNVFGGFFSFHVFHSIKEGRYSLYFVQKKIAVTSNLERRSGDL